MKKQPQQHPRIKRVLVPVDFSDPSRQALDYAIVLAKPFKAEIILLHVVETVLPPPDAVIVNSAEFAAALNEEAVKCLSKWRKEVATRAPVEELLLTGTPYREIVDAGDTSKADLIIMGTRGRSGLARWLIGSTAERVVREAHCPVLVVRGQEPASGTASQKEAPPPPPQT